jgi:hypothetical protein
VNGSAPHSGRGGRRFKSCPAQERERSVARAAEEAKRAEAERAAVAEAQKIVAIWNARRLAGEPCGSIQRRAISSKLPARGSFSSPDERHNLRDRASVPVAGRRSPWRLFTSILSVLPRRCHPHPTASLLDVVWLAEARNADGRVNGSRSPKWWGSTKPGVGA